MQFFAALVLIWASLPQAPASAAEALVAVAANFAEVMERLEAEFEARTEHSLTVATGSTGKLYAQIAAGAPFDVLLAADQVRPARLEKEGLAVAGTRFSYATGILTLWSADAGLIDDDGAAVLRAADFRRLAIANPELAPYGAAARQVLRELGLYNRLRDRIVMGENVAQAHAMVATGNAEIGLIALSYVLSPRNTVNGSRWDVPSSLYEPIRQDAVLLTHGRDNPAALDWLDFLRGDLARTVIRESGYQVD